MKIIKKMAGKLQDNWEKEGVTLGFLGDSVTQGCFELYQKTDGSIETYFDQRSTYHGYVARLLSMLYPNVPINIINAGISGDNAPHAAERLERDILSHHPDLVVVCFGLNDAMNGMEKIQDYTEALSDIFKKLKEADVETIFMTPNMMNTELSPHLEKDAFCNMAKDTMKIQNTGVMDEYIAAAVDVCHKYGVKVCDCYRKWKKLAEGGVCTTELLVNYINHPSREMNWLFAVSLVETMFGI